jgi:transcriptional regulator GlxA family with amidase domain
MKKHVGILVFDDVEVLDFAGPFEVFAVADELSGHAAFNVFTVALRPGVVRANNGLKVVPDYTVDDCPVPAVLVVPGGFGTRALMGNPVIIEWIRSASGRSEVTLSICTGALLLAKAGLLDGLRVTTHHDLLGMLGELAPLAVVDPGARFHDNGAIVTAAGISAGIDASLHVVGRFLGAGSAEGTATYMEYGPGL